MRVAVRRQARNKSVRSRCKTSITSAEKQIFSGQVEAARDAVKNAISTLDKAAGRGIIHPNNASRRKSRLVKKLDSAETQTSAKESE